MAVGPGGSDFPAAVGVPSDHGLDIEGLYLRYSRDLRALVYSLTSDPHLAEDVVQETFLRLHRRLGALDRERPVWPWLCTVAKRLVIDAARSSEASNVSLHPASLTETPDHAPDPGELFLEKERHVAVSQILQGLNSRHRRLLLLREVEDLRCEAIAYSEGISQDAVKSVLARARRAFRDAYERATERGLTVRLWPVAGALSARWRAVKARFQTGFASSVFSGPLGGVLQGAALNLAVTVSLIAALSSAASAALTPEARTSREPSTGISSLASTSGPGLFATTPGSPDSSAGWSVETSASAGSRRSSASASASAGVQAGSTIKVSAKVQTETEVGDGESTSDTEINCQHKRIHRVCQALPDSTLGLR